MRPGRRLHTNFHECLPPSSKATVDHENAPRIKDAGQVTDQRKPNARAAVHTAIWLLNCNKPHCRRGPFWAHAQGKAILAQRKIAQFGSILPWGCLTLPRGQAPYQGPQPFPSVRLGPFGPLRRGLITASSLTWTSTHEQAGRSGGGDLLTGSTPRPLAGGPVTNFSDGPVSLRVP